MIWLYAFLALVIIVPISAVLGMGYMMGAGEVLIPLHLVGTASLAYVWYEHTDHTLTTWLLALISLLLPFIILGLTERDFAREAEDRHDPDDYWDVVD